MRRPARLLPAPGTGGRLLAVALAGTTLVACGATPAEDAAGGGEAAGGPWSYDTGRGETVEMEAPPERLVMDALSAATLIPMGVEPVAIFSTVPMTEEPLLADLDLEGITSVGEAYGEVSVEAVAGVDPDAIVAGFYPADGRIAGIDPGDETTVANLERLAPLVTVEQGGSQVATLERYEAFAEGLGADTDTAERTAERERFDAAVTDLQETLEGPAVSVLPVSLSPDQLSVAVADDFGELIDLEEWGVDVAGPPDGNFFEIVSWENAGRYDDADLVYYDARPGVPGPDEVGTAQALLDRWPAVAAGDLAEWQIDSYVSWARYADYLESFTTAVDEAQSRG